MAANVCPDFAGIYDPNTLAKLSFDDTWPVGEGPKAITVFKTKRAQVPVESLYLAQLKNPALAEHYELLNTLFATQTGLREVDETTYQTGLEGRQAPTHSLQPSLAAEPQWLNLWGTVCTKGKDSVFELNRKRVLRTGAFLHHGGYIWAVIIPPKEAEASRSRQASVNRAARLIGIAPYVVGGAIFAKPVLAGKYKSKGTAIFSDPVEPRLYREYNRIIYLRNDHK